MDRIMFATDKNRTIVKGEINGKEAYFLVDTGASINILDQSRMNEFHWSNQGILGNVVGVEGDENETYRVSNCKILLGEYEVVQFASMQMDASVNSIYRETGIKIVGIIGFPGIQQLNMVIDISNRYIDIRVD